MPSFELTSGIALHYFDEGAGEPLVLIHGFPFSADLYQPQRAALSSRFRVITPDLRGMGRSDATPDATDYSVEAYADDVVALMDHLGIGQAIVGGMSMGGYVVFALLRRHPDRVRGVILIDTKAGADTQEGKEGRRAMIAHAQNNGAGAVADAMLPKMLTEQTRSSQPELATFMREMMASTPVDGIVGALTALMNRPDSTPMLGSVSVPALIIVGSEDGITPRAEAENMRDAMPHAELVVIDGAAHAANVERPDAVNRAIEVWLEQFV
jgi:3-oxoadipate enol-lactonase